MTTEPTAVLWMSKDDMQLLVHALQFVAENAAFDDETTTRFAGIFDNLSDSIERFDTIATSDTIPAKTKRKRRTKAEIAAANAAPDFDRSADLTPEQNGDVDAAMTAHIHGESVVDAESMIDAAIAQAFANQASGNTAGSINLP